MLRVILVAELVVALATASTVAFAYRHIDGRISAGERIHHHAHRQQPARDDSELNILLMGTDRRDCAGCGIDHATGKGGSDTTILLHIADGRRSAYGISIPRDTLVDRPDCTEDGHTVPGAEDATWNTAYAVGGPECTVEQVEAVTGIYVDEYLTVNFGGFKGMVDAIGGVEVCLPQQVDDTTAHIHFDAGVQTLDGERALEYVRERHSTANSDLGRMKRQQAFLASMIDKVMSSDTLGRPDRLFHFASELAGSLETSPDLAGAAPLARLGSSLRHVELDQIRFVTAPTSDFPVGDPRWGRLQLTDEAPKLWRRVIHDQPLGRLGHGAITAEHPHGPREDAAANGLCA
ncbi:LCP family protein [Nocardioides panaciterrulae]|uniref:LCP family protein required for cell wall assembly n=1 Tax=Nocardioides panaciterrulae TaxID=661492 RepID=A0A7Y9E7B3_9ACTN|nr:LCP family protein required for cell wall assembly [Nocardioides panaciterrulae]